MSDNAHEIDTHECTKCIETCRCTKCVEIFKRVCDWWLAMDCYICGAANIAPTSMCTLCIKNNSYCDKHCKFYPNGDVCHECMKWLSK